MLPQNLGPRPGLRLSLPLCDGASLPARLDGLLPAPRLGPRGPFSSESLWKVLSAEGKACRWWASCVLSKCLVDSGPDTQNRVWGLCGGAVQAGGFSVHGPEDGVSSACGSSSLQGQRTDRGITCTREGSPGEERATKPEHLRRNSRDITVRSGRRLFLSKPAGVSPIFSFFLMTSAKLPISPHVLILGN